MTLTPAARATPHPGRAPALPLLHLSRQLPQLPLLPLLTRLAWAAGLLGASLLAAHAVQAQPQAAGPAPTKAQATPASPVPGPAPTAAKAPPHKVARDLQLALDARQAPVVPWLREVNGQRVVRVQITGQGRGAELIDVREEIGRRGGQVLSHDPATSSALAVLPAALVAPIASRADVMHVAPDRLEGMSGSQAGAVTAVPGFAPGTTTLRGRNDLALLGE